jgi:hypothetical protein
MIGFCNPARIMLLGKQTCEFPSRIITEKYKTSKSACPAAPSPHPAAVGEA